VKAAAASIALLALACSAPRSSYVRVVAEDGRLYYANMDKALHSPSGGFLAFRDLVTGESVQLKNGSYLAQTCPQEEVAAQQQAFLDDPTRPPRVPDEPVAKR
jgi:hypothetical protein